MSYSLKLRQKDYCLNSSATIGSDNSFNSLTLLEYIYIKGVKSRGKQKHYPLFALMCQSIGLKHLVKRNESIIL